MEFTSSCEHGGRFEDAAILNGRRKHDTSTCGCGKVERKFYVSEVSTNKRLFYFKLFQVLFFRLHHAEDEAVALSHALSVWRLDVLLDDLLPATPAQPAAEEALHLLNFPQLSGILARLAQQVGCIADGALGVRLVGSRSGGGRAEAAPSHGRCREGRPGRLLTQNADLKSINSLLSRHRYLSDSINLRPELSYLRSELLALLSVLPLGRLFALDNLKQMNMLLFQLLLLKQQFVEA